VPCLDHDHKIKTTTSKVLGGSIASCIIAYRHGEYHAPPLVRLTLVLLMATVRQTVAHETLKH
jgi:hypothetical protein